MQSQVVCSGCRSLLLFPSGATNVSCALCNTITAVTPPGSELAQLVCGGCRTLLMYPRGATSIKCSCCNTINLARSANQVAHMNCGRCRTTLMFPYGAPSVKCAVCHYITPILMTNIPAPVSSHAPTTTLQASAPPSTSTPQPRANVQTVVIENPKSVDANGKLVSNVVVGVTTAKK